MTRETKIEFLKDVLFNVLNTDEFTDLMQHFRKFAGGERVMDANNDELEKHVRDLVDCGSVVRYYQPENAEIYYIHFNAGENEWEIYGFNNDCYEDWNEAIGLNGIINDLVDNEDVYTYLHCMLGTEYTDTLAKYEPQRHIFDMERVRVNHTGEPCPSNVIENDYKVIDWEARRWELVRLAFGKWAVGNFSQDDAKNMLNAADVMISEYRDFTDAAD